MNSDRVVLDGKKRKLFLKGNCLELLPLCGAACCVDWSVGLAPEEYDSGLYKAERMCLLTQKECEKTAEKCIHRTYQLKKNTDGVCVYLDDHNQCSIYKNRPKVCRDFTCQGGWRLSSVFPIGNDETIRGQKLEKEAFIEQLTDDMVLVLHPLIKLHTVFYLKAKEEIIFVKEMVGKCGKFHTRDNFRYPQLNDKLLSALINSFSSKDSLKDTLERFCDQHAISLTKSEWYEIVWLLNKHNIVLGAANFHGMLAGMGGI
jgi:Fe-S-cluster containining protein